MTPFDNLPRDVPIKDSAPALAERCRQALREAGLSDEVMDYATPDYLATMQRLGRERADSEARTALLGGEDVGDATTGHTADVARAAARLSSAEKARRAADSRHRETRELRQQVVDHYKANRSTFASKNAAAEAMAHKLVPLPFVTVRDYLKGV